MPNAVHERHPWVISAIAPDFELLDAWGLPIEGDREDFGAAIGILEKFDPVNSTPLATRVLFRLRFRIGGWFGWDNRSRRLAIPNRPETSLAARLPEELKGSADLPRVSNAIRDAAGAFVPLYRTDTEWAAEISNATVHGVLQLCWVDQGNGRWRGRLGVYVKPRGLRGRMYLHLIGPFRHLIVYPQLIDAIAAAWRATGRREAAEGVVSGTL